MGQIEIGPAKKEECKYEEPIETEMTEANDHFDKVIDYKIKPDKKRIGATRPEQDLVDLLDQGLEVPNPRNFDDSYHHEQKIAEPQTERVTKNSIPDGSDSDQAIKVGMRLTRQDRKARKKKTPVRAVIEMDKLLEEHNKNERK